MMRHKNCLLKAFWVVSGLLGTIGLSIILGLESDLLGAEGSSSNASSTEAVFHADEEKARLLNQLKTQIEPNLLERDLKRLRRDVMRLGGFRADWVRDAEKFLAGNSALAELILYDFSRIKNGRLNEKILETLLMFTNYQFPLAPLAFESDLSQNPQGRSLLYRLLARVVSQQPQVAGTYVTWLIGQTDSSADYFQVYLSACRAQARFEGEVRSQIEERLSLAPQDFWSRLVIDDLRACLRGI
jgi:hypothetical protein